MDMVHDVVFCFKKYIGIIVLSILRCKTAPLSLFPLFKLTRSYNAYGEKKKALSASHKDYLSNTNFIYRFMFLGEGLAYIEERSI